MLTEQKRKPKILMFGWEFPPYVAGGLGTACHGMVKALIRRGFDITLILPKNVTSSKEDGLTILGAEFFDFCVKTKIQEKLIENIRTIEIESPIEPYLTINEPLQMSRLSEEAIQQILSEEHKTVEHSSVAGNKSVYGDNLIEEVVRYNQVAGSIAGSLSFDVIHCHDWLTFGAGIVAKEVTGKPLLCHVHATEFDRCPGNGNDQVRHFEKTGCEAADKVMAVSQFTKDILINNYGINSNKIDVLHNGIDLASQSKKVEKKTNKKPKVLFLGRVTYQKGPNYFLEAAHRVLQVNSNVEFIVAGAGDMVDYLRGRAYELGIQESVNFTGPLKGNAVKEAYQLADCFVLSSVSEPFGLTPLEALSNRLPVIISKQSGVSEVLKHVLRYDFWDVERLASLILSVLTYKTLSNELQERAYDDLHPISWDRVAGNLEQKYFEVCESSLVAA